MLMVKEVLACFFLCLVCWTNSSPHDSVVMLDLAVFTFLDLLISTSNHKILHARKVTLAHLLKRATVFRANKSLPKFTYKLAGHQLFLFLTSPFLKSIVNFVPVSIFHLTFQVTFTQPGTYFLGSCFAKCLWKECNWSRSLKFCFQMAWKLLKITHLLPNLHVFFGANILEKQAGPRGAGGVWSLATWNRCLLLTTFLHTGILCMLCSFSDDPQFISLWNLNCYLPLICQWPQTNNVHVFLLYCSLSTDLCWDFVCPCSSILSTHPQKVSHLE